MDSIIIGGGKPLNGDIPISGAKNSALKLMAAALLTDEKITLTNMPRLRDTRFLADLLGDLGMAVDEEGDNVTHLHAPHITSTVAPYDRVRKMRASFNVLGPLLARAGKAEVSLPGGCAIGARPVDLHLQAISRFGAAIELSAGYVHAFAPDGLRGGHVNFPFVSVGATEHAMMTAALAKGESVLENAAREPEIVDLADFLNSFGAKIEGAGTSTIRIEGVERLSGGTYSVVPDRIETGTFAIAATAAGGKVRLTGVREEHLHALWPLLEAAGAEIGLNGDSVTISRDPSSRPHSVDMATQPYPGFPTDLQAQFMALMTIADGASVIRENIFENRFMHAPELNRMGANIRVDGNEAVVRGVESLVGAPVMATDLRASVSLVIAGLVAEGQTQVNRVYHLDRGFERLEEKLGRVGAEVRRAPGE
ncbi:UDP-N-acetylglucosamine 1-carboxyvinyltransferase [Euryhalocaulis caribicus]|uniref:UDP-N-acetylglucosamine 1-carboxyvinyltransferase n=1 Tax=Euryhalocaulis caribicus TaxID=1161401 RepID=UPI00039B8816|nr:UDP-N-acetylglucosamine 1-carboxyvinyltransferase [Euryhalocaulis caribicus]